MLTTPYIVGFHLYLIMSAIQVSYTGDAGVTLARQPEKLATTDGSLDKHPAEWLALVRLKGQ
jgi:hypothetical protein